MIVQAQNQENPLKEALKKARSTFCSAGLFACAVNVLMLTGPLFMLQIYDRVLASRSVPTLAVLFGLVVVLYLFLGLFDFIQKKTLSRAGYRLDIELAALAKKVWIFSKLSSSQQKIRPINDLTRLRKFLCSNGLPALFNLPWVPVYLAVVYMLHVWLGLLASAGAVIVIITTLINEWITKKPIGVATAWELQDTQFAEESNRSAEAIIAMGMVRKITNHWQTLRHKALEQLQLAGDRSEFITAITKAVRMLIQSSILALGAYLAIYQEITPGAMIAASILGGRALAPIDLAVGNWKNFILARHALSRLLVVLQDSSGKQTPIRLPEPKARLTVSDLLKFVPGNKINSSNKRPVLRSGSVYLNSLAEFYKWISALLLCGNRDWRHAVKVNLIGGLPVKR